MEHRIFVFYTKTGWVVLDPEENIDGHQCTVAVRFLKEHAWTIGQEFC